MNLLETLGDLGGLLIGLSLTIAILSYVIKDNPLYRLAVHILVGVSAGFTTIVLIEGVFLPIFDSVTQATSIVDSIFWLVPILLAVFLLLKLSPRTGAIGNIAMAALIGVGASVGLVGAVTGTLIPQVLLRYDEAILGFIAAVLAALTLFYFFFTGRESASGTALMPVWFPYIQIAGKVVITITLAGLFVSVLNTSLVLLVGRVGFYFTSMAEIVEVFLQ